MAQYLKEIISFIISEYALALWRLSMHFTSTPNQEMSLSRSPSTRCCCCYCAYTIELIRAKNIDATPLKRVARLAFLSLLLLLLMTPNRPTLSNEPVKPSERRRAGAAHALCFNAFQCMVWQHSLGAHVSTKLILQYTRAVAMHYTSTYLLFGANTIVSDASSSQPLFNSHHRDTQQLLWRNVEDTRKNPALFSAF